MMESPLFDYYSKNEATMLKNIRKDKLANGYKNHFKENVQS